MSWNYPQTDLIPEEYVLGSKRITDPLLWLTDNQDEKVLAWTKAQNQYTDRFFEQYGTKLKEYEAAVKERCTKAEFSSVSILPDGYLAMRKAEDGTYSVVETDERFNVRKVVYSAEDYPEGKLYSVTPAPGGSGIYAIWTLKSRAARMSVVVVADGKRLAELDETFSFAWSVDGKYIYYAEGLPREDGTLCNRIRKYSVADDTNTVIYEDPGHSPYVIISSHPDGGIVAHVRMDYHDAKVLRIGADDRVRELNAPLCSLDYIGTAGGRDYFITDLDWSNYKIISVPQDEYDISMAEDVYRQPEGLLAAAVVNKNAIVTDHIENASSIIRVRDIDGSNVRSIKSPDEYCKIDSYFTATGGNEIIVGYESFGCPPSLLRINVKEASSSLVYTSGERADDMVAERRFLPSFDGQQIAAFLVYKKGAAPSGDMPTLLYGYGGYNASHLPTSVAVDMSVAEWVKKGGLYVHCILRGGCEFGEEWHRGGNLDNKKNVFMDMAAIAKYVIDEGWTKRERLAITGLSNGGLLVTATSVLYPEYVGCVLASVPHTDMLHFALDDRGSMYVTEYGDPRTDEYYEYMRSYSPYHNVRSGVQYPAYYIQTGEYDNNVPPYHGKKFAAALQQLDSEKPVVLRVLPYGSHDCGDGEYFYRTVAELELFRDLMLKVI